MKHWQISLAIIAALSASLALADDFKTTAGKEYKNATVSRVEADGIVVKFHGGIAKIFLVELPPEIQKQYGYGLEAAIQKKAAPQANGRTLMLRWQNPASKVCRRSGLN